MKIFVSYSRRDAGDFANQIQRHLSTFNYDVFTDVDSIKAGEVWNNTIEENISNCDIFTVIVTYGALHSPHVEREVLQAQKEKKKIIPCFHKDVIDSDIKWGLERIQGIGFTNGYELARNLYSNIDIETDFSNNKDTTRIFRPISQPDDIKTDAMILAKHDLRSELIQLLKREDIAEFNNLYPEYRYRSYPHEIISLYLEGEDFRGINLRYVNLEGSMLIGANLDGVDLREADLKNVNFRKPSLRNALIVGANLEGVNLREADLEGAVIIGCNINLSIKIERTIFNNTIIDNNEIERELKSKNINNFVKPQNKIMLKKILEERGYPDKIIFSILNKSVLPDD